jgi:hypothetical protein
MVSYDVHKSVAAAWYGTTHVKDPKSLGCKSRTIERVKEGVEIFSPCLTPTWTQIKKFHPSRQWTGSKLQAGKRKKEIIIYAMDTT